MMESLRRIIILQTVTKVTAIIIPNRITRAKKNLTLTIIDKARPRPRLARTTIQRTNKVSQARSQLVSLTTSANILTRMAIFYPKKSNDARMKAYASSAPLKGTSLQIVLPHERSQTILQKDTLPRWKH